MVTTWLWTCIPEVKAEMEQTTEKNQAIFYGWWIVLGGWLCMFVGGAAMFSLSIFMPPLMKEYGWTREMLSQA